MDEAAIVVNPASTLKVNRAISGILLAAGALDGIISVAHAVGKTPLARLPGDAAVWGIAAVVFLVSALALARRTLGAIQAGVPLPEEWCFTWRSAGISYAGALVITTVVASLTKLVIESRGASYIIHWESTLIAVAVPLAWVVHSVMVNRRK